MKSVLNPPNALMLMESTRAVGYSLEAAVADIIDNSISANAERIDVFFSAAKESYFAILDDGIGMTISELYSAMQYGCKNPTDQRDDKDLGRFGLGLKTASLSQCKVLTVASKKGDSICAYRWDLNHIRANNDWLMLELDQDDITEIPCIEKLQNYDSGTLVLWTELDKLAMSDRTIQDAFREKIPLVRNHLELVFHRFICGEIGIKKVTFRINGLELEKIDPFLKSKSQQIMDIEHININGNTVSVTPYILPHQNKLTRDELIMLGGKDGLRRSQGFYVYRNKRLLVAGTWFRLVKTDDLSKLARVQVDIPNTLDEEWTLDIKKSKATPPDVVKQNLKRIVDKIANTSANVYRTRGKIETDKNRIHPWVRTRLRDGSILYDINRKYPLIEELKKSLDDSQKEILEKSFTFIERGLPMHSIRLDINSERPLSFEQNNDKEDLIKQTIVDMFRRTDDIDVVKDALYICEPFASYQHLIDEVYKENRDEY